jgi:hypothetical protein
LAYQGGNSRVAEFSMLDSRGSVVLLTVLRLESPATRIL